MSQQQFSHKYYKAMIVLDKGFLVSHVFWHVMPCILTYNYQPFKENCHLHLLASALKFHEMVQLIMLVL